MIYRTKKINPLDYYKQEYHFMDTNKTKFEESTPFPFFFINLKTNHTINKKQIYQ